VIHRVDLYAYRWCTLHLNMPHRLHSLWWLPLLPILFYLSAIVADLCMGTLVYRGAMCILHRREDRTIVHGLCRLVVGFSVVYLIAKLVEVGWAGEAALLWSASVAVYWWAELGIGVVAPVVL